MLKLAHHKTKTILIVTFLFAVASASGAPIFESGFSDPSLPAGPYERLDAATSIGPWTVGGSGVDWVGNYWQSADGDGASIDINKEAGGSLSTILAGATAGQRYTMTFAMAGNPDTLAYDTNHVKSMRVSVGGVTQDFTFDVANRFGAGASSSRADMGWVYYSLNFTATGNDLLTFSSLNPNTMWGAALDNVSISPREDVVPEPSSVLLLGAGLAGLLWARRRQTA